VLLNRLKEKNEEEEHRAEQIEHIKQTLKKIQEIVMHYTWTNIHIDTKQRT